MPAASTPLISDDAVNQALAEIEADPKTESLPVGSSPVSVQPGAGPSPAPPGAPPPNPDAQPSRQPEGAPDDDGSTQSLDAQLAAAAAGDPPTAAKNKRRFTINRRTGAAAKAAAAQATEALAALTGPPPTAPSQSRFPKPLRWITGFFVAAWHTLTHVFDRFFEALNQPIARLDQTLRLCIGFSGISAGVLAVVLMIIAPSLRPKRDAISFVHEKRYQVEHPPPKVTEPEAEKEESKGAHKPAGGHEEKKPQH